MGGTTEAHLLADAVARAGLEATYSYGGRTREPAVLPLPTRVGGFGGARGLAEYIHREGITHVVDATHPFAAEISRNAVAACARTATPLIALERAPWTKAPGDNWVEVADIAAAVLALPLESTRVFLAIGRQHIASFGAKPQHVYTLRFVDAPDKPLPFPNGEVIVSRGPFVFAEELEMLRSRRIKWVVARNSGGSGARAKIDVARELGLPVVMLRRPELPGRPRVESVAEVLQWLSHRTCLGA